MEGHEEKLQFFAQENSVSAADLEEALLYLRQKSSRLSAVGGGPAGGGGGNYPDFLENGTTESSDVNATSAEHPTSADQHTKQLRSELSQVQAHHVEAVNELEKTRSLLRVQANINSEQKNEIEALQQRLLQVKAEFQGQIGEYKKLLDMRASRIHKLEMQLRENTYGQVAKNVNVSSLMTAANSGTSVHTPSGQSLFEIHVQKVNLTKECVVDIGMPEPKIFATWTFYEHDMQYTPVADGPKALIDCSAFYKVKLDDAFLDYLVDSIVQVNTEKIIRSFTEFFH